MFRRLLFPYRFFIISLIIAILLPFLGIGTYWTHVVVVIFIYSIVAFSWDLLVGCAGQLSLAQAGFFGIGAYTSGLLAVHFGLSPWLGLLLGGLVAAMFGLLVGIPSLRIRGPYLALATLAFSETMRVVMRIWVDVTRGPLGLETPHFPGLPFSRTNYYFLALSLLTVSLVVFYKISGSKLGMILRAIREDETLAQVLGINVTNYKLLAFTISAFFCGIAGSFYAHYIGIITPNELGSKLTILTLSMSVVGGMGTTFGPLVGAFVIQFLTENLRLFGVVYDLIAVGILLMTTMLFFPGGIMGTIHRVHRWLIARARAGANHKS